MKLLFRKFAKLANLKHKKKADTYKCTAEELETFAELVIQECLSVAAKSVAEHFIYQDDDEGEDYDESSSYSEINEIKEIWGVDFNDPYLDLDDIPGCR